MGEEHFTNSSFVVFVHCCEAILVLEFRDTGQINSRVSIHNMVTLKNIKLFSVLHLNLFSDQRKCVTRRFRRSL
jgi:hypothetical protein